MMAVDAEPSGPLGAECEGGVCFDQPKLISASLLTTWQLLRIPQASPSTHPSDALPPPPLRPPSGVDDSHTCVRRGFCVQHGDKAALLHARPGPPGGPRSLKVTAVALLTTDLVQGVDVVCLGTSSNPFFFFFPSSNLKPTIHPTTWPSIGTNPASSSCQCTETLGFSSLWRLLSHRYHKHP